MVKHGALWAGLLGVVIALLIIEVAAFNAPPEDERCYTEYLNKTTCHEKVTAEFNDSPEMHQKCSMCDSCVYTNSTCMGLKSHISCDCTILGAM